jgi:hypothetical protein
MSHKWLHVDRRLSAELKNIAILIFSNGELCFSRYYGSRTVPCTFYYRPQIGTNKGELAPFYVLLFWAFLMDFV